MSKSKEIEKDPQLLKETLDKIYGTSEHWIPNVPNRIIRNLARCRKNFGIAFSIDQEIKLLHDTMINLDLLLRCLNVSWQNYNLDEKLEDK